MLPWDGVCSCHGILGGYDEEGLSRHVGFAVDGHLALFHAFQQAGLCPGRGAVDFVRQKDIGEDRASAQHERVLLPVEDVQARDVAGEEIRRELDPRETGADAFGQRLGQLRLAGAGHVLQQHMSVCQQRSQEQPGRLLLSHDDFCDVGEDFFPQCFSAMFHLIECPLFRLCGCMVF